MTTGPQVGEFWWIKTPHYGLRVVQVDFIHATKGWIFTLGCGDHRSTRTALPSFISKVEPPCQP